MERKERESIMRQGATRPETSRDRRERQALEQDLRESPVKGKPIRRRLRNFRPDASAQLTAMGGPLAWMRRLRAIERAIAEHERRLSTARSEVLERCGSDRDLCAREWRRLAERWNFTEVNDLIADHNRYFPAEARLPMNPRTGDFVPFNGRPYTKEPLDASWILERFPAR